MGTSKRSGRHSALMFLDLDNFKPLNDAHGHFMGDLLLVEVARRLSGCVRGVDVVARFGGDEFVIVLSEIGVNKAEATAQSRLIAEKLRVNINRPYVLQYMEGNDTSANVEHICTASIGVVVFFDGDSNQDEILKRADAAMYKAKELGGNRIQFHSVTS
jgi:diguanylate cyclase (GGDEF)-like protein